MRRGMVIALLLLTMVVPSVHAQIPVIDPANLVQTILIAERTRAHLQELIAQYQTIVRMAQGLGHLSQYRIPAIGIVGHDPSRWQYGRPWIQGLVTGDPRGTAYWQTTLPIQPPGSELDGLSPAARQFFEREYATVEITDSIAQIGGHQVALVRGYDGRLQQAVQSLQADVLNTDPKYHQMTAVLDKIAAGELLERRQDMASNQLLSHTLEQLLARNKQLRDTEAAAINMQLSTWRDGPAANAAFVAGTGDALRTWRPR